MLNLATMMEVVHPMAIAVEADSNIPDFQRLNHRMTMTTLTMTMMMIVLANHEISDDESQGDIDESQSSDFTSSENGSEDEDIPPNK